MSFYTSLTGLSKATAASVTSNNIANTGTTGLKIRRTLEIFLRIAFTKASSVLVRVWL